MKPFRLAALVSFASALLVGVANRPSAKGESTRHAVPTAAEQKGATQQVERVYRRDPDAARSPGQKTSLAKAMLKTAESVTGDDPGRFALCTTATNVAARAGNASLGLRAAEDLADLFAIDSLKSKAQVLSTAAHLADRALAGRVSTADFDQVIDSALVAGRYDVASETAGSASGFASRTRDAAIMRWATSRKRPLGTRGFIDIAKNNRGWGLEHKVATDDKQYYSWAGKEIPRTVFEDSVKPGPLSLEDSKSLLK